LRNLMVSSAAQALVSRRIFFDTENQHGERTWI
jgi:hypothetical protein